MRSRRISGVVASVAALIAAMLIWSPAQAALTAPSAPQNALAFDIGTTTVRFTWAAPLTNGGSPLTDYRLQLSTTQGFTVETTQVVENIGVVNTYTFTGLSGNTRYYFRVAAKNAVGTGPNSSPINILTSTALPDAPSNLQLVDIGVDYAVLTWDAPASNGGRPVVDYYIEYQLNDTGNWIDYERESSTANTVRIEGLQIAQFYRFRVSALTSFGLGPAAEVDGRTDPRLPEPVHHLRMSALPTATTVGLRWDAPLDTGGLPILYYLVESSTNNGATWQNVTDPAIPRPSATVKGLRPGRETIVRVTAVTAAGESEFPIEIWFTTLP